MTNAKKLSLGIGLALFCAIAAWLAFGVFGIQTAFIDDTVSEDNPFASVNVDMAESFDDMEEEMASGELVVQQRVETSPAEAAMPEMAAESSDADASPAAEIEEPADDAPAEPAEPAVPQIRTVASNNGTLVDHAHVGDGTVNVITDGNQTFLRFEDDFAIDNGPDLNVYLVRGVDANSDPGTFDDDFIDLGDLKGNIGAQNYELPAGVDVGEFDTVVIWCVRFGVAFNAADLG